MDVQVVRPSNRFLVRQRDRRWLGVLSSTLLLGGVLLAILFLVGWPRLRSTTIHYDLIRLRSEVDELRRHERTLELAAEEARSPARLMARGEALGLEPPDSQEPSPTPEPAP